MWAAFSLWRQAKRARPQAYVTKKAVAQSYASRTMRWGGVIIAAVHRLPHPRPHLRRREPRRHGLDALRPAGRELPEPRRRPPFYVVALILLGMHLRHGLWSATQTLGQSNRRRERTVNAVATGVRRPPHRRLPRGAGRRRLRARGLRNRNALLMPLELFTAGEPDRRHQGPDGRADRRALERAQVPRPPGQPGQPPQDDGHRRRHRPGRRLGRRDARRGRLQGQVVLLPGQPAPRAQRRRAGRHQRRQELPQRRRQRAPAVLRHGQGRRLPLPREQRVPPGRGQRQHHRPVRRPGRAVRPRVRRPARQPLLRRRPGLAHLLRPRPDGPAAALRRLPGAGAADRGRQRRAARPHRDARPDRRRRPGPRHRRPRPGHRRDQHALRRRGRAGHRRLRQRLLPVHQRQGLQRHGDLAGAQAGRATSPTPATRRSTRPASRSRATTSRSSR